jgi:glutathione S-transferase
VNTAVVILERELTRKPFLAGEQFSFGDIPVATTAQRWFNLPIARPEVKALSAWYERINQHAGFKRWVDLPLY